MWPGTHNKLLCAAKYCPSTDSLTSHTRGFIPYMEKRSNVMEFMRKISNQCMGKKQTAIYLTETTHTG